MGARAIRGVFLFFVVGLVLPGCAKLSHLRELLTLQAYSDNNEEKARFIENADQCFEALVQDLNSGRLTRTMRQEDIRRGYGVPIYDKIITGEARTLWMYRRQTDYAGKEKVYLYFDEQGMLIRWEVETSGLPDPSS